MSAPRTTDRIITSLDFNENSRFHQPYLPSSGTWIGEDCACPCHTPPHNSFRKTAKCCHTLHEETIA